MRNLATKLQIAITALALALPGVARAADAPPCLTAPEFTALASYALPSIINGIGQRCAASLPATSFLSTGAPALAARYAQSKPAAWPGAKAAFIKLGSGQPGSPGDLLKGLPDATLQQIIDATVSGVVVEKLPLERCRPVDRILRLLAPLPPESTAEIVATAVGLSTRLGEAHFGKVSICRE